MLLTFPLQDDLVITGKAQNVSSLLDSMSFESTKCCESCSEMINSNIESYTLDFDVNSRSRPVPTTFMPVM